MRLAQIRLLVIDDFALQPMDATATADFYELVVAGSSAAQRSIVSLPTMSTIAAN